MTRQTDTWKILKEYTQISKDMARSVMSDASRLHNRSVCFLACITSLSGP